jgi:putative glutamine amidotransferase
MPIIALPPYAKLRDYETAIRLAGGEPRRLEIGRDDPDEVIRSVDAVLLPGGGDVEPSYYGEARHPTFDAAEAGRDELEIALANKAREADMPLLAICRGIQVLNVARGGSLIQDIPDQVPGALTHVRREPADSIAHDVEVVVDSRLGGILFPSASSAGAPRFRRSDPSELTRTVAVNSRHHQAIRILGENLLGTAGSSDGIVEAVEDPWMRFCIGVQWHPENFHRTGEFAALFKAFIEAAKNRRG